MPIVFLITMILTVILTFIILSLALLKDIVSSHNVAHVTKFSNNGKFNEAFNLSMIDDADDKKLYFRPVVDLDDKNIRNIIFVNNVNCVVLSNDDKLVFELNLAAKDDTYYYFITENYKIDDKQNLATNLITSNFPKMFENDVNYYNFLNLRDLGYEGNNRSKIKTDDIVGLVFNGKSREMIILVNDAEQTAFYVKYKSKQEMVALIKKTTLYKQIMQ